MYSNINQVKTHLRCKPSTVKTFFLKKQDMTNFRKLENFLDHLQVDEKLCVIEKRNQTLIVTSSLR